MQRKIRATKRAARSELSVSKGEWCKHGYADTNILSIQGIKDDIPRVHISVSAGAGSCQVNTLASFQLGRSPCVN